MRDKRTTNNCLMFMVMSGRNVRLNVKGQIESGNVNVNFLRRCQLVSYLYLICSGRDPHVESLRSD